MKRAILIIVIIAAAGGALLWMRERGEKTGPTSEKPAGDKAASEKPESGKGGEEKPEGGGVSRDAAGRVILKMNDEAQGNAGIKVAHPSASELAAELQGYGRVLDPTPLAALLNELASAEAAHAASSNELVRLNTLSGQGNASVRALQTAEAAAQRDRLAIQSARDRLALSWSVAVAGQADLPSFIRSLTSLGAALARIDLPGGEAATGLPVSARLIRLSGETVEAAVLGPASNIDPQIQGRGFILLVKPNTARLLPGEGLTGYLKIPGRPVGGVIIPREAVVRTESSGWVYSLNDGGESFTRVGIALDRPTESGWFVTNGVTATNYVVVEGAQTLLSEELKGALGPD